MKNIIPLNKHRIREIKQVVWGIGIKKDRIKRYYMKGVINDIIGKVETF